jgi:hypothetical protein
VGLPPEAQGLTPEQIRSIAEGRIPFIPQALGEVGDEMSEVEVADSLAELGILPDQVDPREYGPVRR